MNSKFRFLVAALFAGGLFSITSPIMADTQAPGAASPNLGATPMTDTKTFQDFGGREGLVKLMDDFMNNLVADPRTKPFFDTPKKEFIKAMLVEQLCEIMNGGCKYSGRDMATAHANMKVNRASFNALVEDLQVSMDKFKIPFSSQNKLLAKLAPMYRAIETTKGDAVPPKDVQTAK
ncbi:MAG: group I truncated hemoglobin [Candidatus Binatia bacterium]